MTAYRPDSVMPTAAGTPVPLQRMDIIAWWERERARTLAECQTAAERITQTALDAIDAVPDRTLVLKGSRVLRPVREQIEAELAAVNQDLARSLQMGLTDVVERIEGRDGADSPDKTLQETATLAAGGVGMAAAAGGLAFSATSLATASSTILFVIPVVAISWPVFLLAGAVAALLGTVSTTALVKTGKQRKRRCRMDVQTRIQDSLLAEDADPVSSWPHFRQQLDRARDTMLAQLT
ncbi:MAG: hypothetical protein OXC91_03885 [Rhodobacteraceae bacterium]|nr:hypothetical protein [Paracoccaceae bacterium]